MDTAECVLCSITELNIFVWKYADKVCPVLALLADNAMYPKRDTGTSDIGGTARAQRI